MTRDPARPERSCWAKTGFHPTPRSKGCAKPAPRGGLVSLNRTPLARKIIIFNMMALVILVAGVLFLNPFRDSLVLQREAGLIREAELIADVFEAQLQPGRRPASTYAAALGRGRLGRGRRGVCLRSGGRPRRQPRRPAGDRRRYARRRALHRDHRFPERGLDRRFQHPDASAPISRQRSTVPVWRARSFPGRAAGETGSHIGPRWRRRHAVFRRHTDLVGGRSAGRDCPDLGRGRDRPAGAL